MRESIIINITDLELPELKLYRTLRGNQFDEDGSFIADSPRVVEQLFESGLEFKSLLCTPKYFEKEYKRIELANIPTIYLGEKGLLQKIVGHKIHHNVMAHLVRPKSVEISELPDQVVMLDRLNNMENVGAIARSMAGLGVRGYVVPSYGPHPYGRRAIRVSTGHITRLKTHIYSDPLSTIKALKEAGYKILVAEVNPDSTPLAKFRSIPKKWVLILGNEEEGVGEALLNEADNILQIEIESDVKSFNVATSGAIIMHWLKVYS